MKPLVSANFLFGSAILCGSLAGAAGCSQTPPEQCAAKPMSVPGTSMVLEPDWGVPTQQYTAAVRPLPVMNVTYVNGTVAHNPIYMHDLDEPLEYRDRPPTFGEEMVGLANIPWFYVNLGITPVLMCFELPLKQVYSSGVAPEGVYNGNLPATEYPAVAPEKGQLSWPQPKTNLSAGQADATTAPIK
jgi:hypothetical protein